MADKSSSTGTGGINIDGKVYDMDVGLPDFEGGAQGNWSPGDVAVDNTQKDITVPTKETFSKYLSRATLGQIGSSPHANKFPVGVGAGTAYIEVSVTDADGLPVPPGPQLNETKFNNDVNLSIGAPTAPIKKGLAPGSAPDGNSLLPGAADPAPAGGAYVKPSAGLKDPINSYTAAVVSPNLYDPISAPPLVPVVMGEGGGVEPSGIRGLVVTTTLADDGGTSANIMQPDDAHTLSLFEQTAKVIDETAGNYYKISKNANSLEASLIDVDSSAVLSDPNNPKFADIGIGSSPVISRGKLINGTAADPLPNGNDLLLGATTPAPAGGNYVKSSGGLKDPIKAYTAQVVEPNLNDDSVLSVVMSDGSLGNSPGNLRELRIIPPGASPATVGGSSDVILGPPGASGENILTLKEEVEIASVSTEVNKFSVAKPGLNLTQKITDSYGDPLSATHSQNNPQNINYFTKGKVLQGTYSPEFSSAQTASPDPFLIKRGKDSGGIGPDGHELLPDAADPAPAGGNYVKPSAGLKDGVKTYTRVVLDKNLKSPTDDPAPALIDSGTDDSPPLGQGAWPLRTPVDFAVDSGTSAGMLDSASDSHKLTLLKAANKAAAQTLTNKFQVDLASAAGPEEPQTSSVLDAQGLPLSPSDAQNNPSNSDYYTKGKYVPNSYSESASNLNIKRGKAPGNNPDGNELLIDAAKTINVGGVPGLGSPARAGTIGTTVLQGTIKDYTGAVLDKNLKKPGDQTEDVQFFGYSPLHDTNSSSDAGTFENVRANPQSREIDRAQMQAYAAAQRSGAVNASGIPNANRPTQNLLNPSLYETSIEGYPRSPTSEQKSESDPGYYAPGKEVPTSYSDYAVKSNLNTLMKRGKAKGSAPDGNSLLKNAAAPAPSDPKAPYVKPAGELKEPIKDYVSAVLKKNRFSRQKKFHIDQSNPEDAAGTQEVDDNAFASPGQLKMGISPGNLDETPRDLEYSRLARVGTILQLRSTGEIQALADQSTDPYDIGTPFASLVPGVGQLGAGVPLSTSLLDVEQIINDLPKNEGQDNAIYNASLVDFGTKFEGTINNVFDKFSGFSAIGMQATAAALAAAVVGAFFLLGGAFGSSSASRVPGSLINPLTPNDLRGLTANRVDSFLWGQGRLGLGAFQAPSTVSSADDIFTAFLPSASGPSVLFSFFGISPTVNDFYTATKEGVMSFFNLSGNVLKAAENPGFNVVMARSIIRSVSSIVLAFADLGKMLVTGNVGESINQLLEILQTLKNSRFFKVINVFAQRGDASIINRNANDVTKQKIDGLDAGEKYSLIDALPNNRPGSAYSKNRLNDNIKGTVGEVLKLAWAANRVPDMLMIPENIVSLGSESTLGPGRLMAYDPLQKTRWLTTNSAAGFRLPTEAVNAIEAEMDSEYVPFYFHDLRTNEILGFHAFLSNLSDDFTANYEQTDGFGRIESIRTYRSTSRKIGLSFIVAALDKNDFESIWAKINKLVTMVYPQYTAGRKIIQRDVDGRETKFTKPFTQLVGAAPMVRMRVGDVITSNYSRFNLAGIFGLTSEDAKISDKRFGDNSVTGVNTNNWINLFLEGQEYSEGTRFRFPGGTKYTDIGGNDFYIDLESIGTIVAVDTSEISAGSPASLSPDKQIYTVEIEAIIANPVSLFANKFFDSPEVASLDSKQEKRTVILSHSDLPASSMLSEDYEKHKKNQESRLAEQQAQERSIEAGRSYNKLAAEFMSDEKNVIAKSFASTGGRGLAGFIESIGFDWMTGTWETETGKKAPKMARVTISFAPIHDISPGLDEFGYNRAPVYRLGPHGR